MRIRLFTILLLFLFSALFYAFDAGEEVRVMRRARSLLLLGSRLQLDYLGDEMVKVRDEAGRTWVKSLAAPKYVGTSANKVIHFHIPDIDTSHISGRFKHFATVPVGSEGAEAIAADTDGDSLREIIGMFKSFEMRGNEPVYNRIYEQAYAGSDSFVLVYDHFPERYSGIELVTDLNQNGLQELVFKVSDQDSLGANFFFYESPAPGELATENIFVHRVFEQTNFKQQPRETDLDRDGMKELLYIGSEFADNVNGWETRAYIAEYQHERQALERVWSINYRELDGGGGNDKAVHDFDMDGKMEFVTSDGRGIVYWVEHTGADNQYSLTRLDTVAIHNTTFHTEGDDLDGDGRPECFIGGSGFTSQGYVNLITCFESIGDNDYEKSVEIQITGIGGFNPEMFTQSDVNGDGRNELVLSIGGTILVLKAVGNDDYEIFWVNQYFNEVLGTTGDVTGDGIDDVLRSKAIYRDNNYSISTDLYHFDFGSTDILANKQTNRMKFFKLNALYPNPFNSVVNIEWEQQRGEWITLQIYNLMGETVRLIANRLFDPGLHKMQWNGRDDLNNIVASGIYLCTLKTSTELICNRIIFLK